MASLIPDFEYDIFISYRQKDNRHDSWVTRFVDNLKGELEATFKEDVSVYFDENPHDRLQETHNVDKSLESKLKCLIFIPILSQTYCDPNSYAWQNELLAFLRLSEEDRFGRYVKLRNGNIADRILPVRIYDLDPDDVKLFEKETGSVLRALDFVFKMSTGVNRPLRANEDHVNDNLNKTFYSDQINKVANAIKEIITGLKTEPAPLVKEKTQSPERSEDVNIEERRTEPEKSARSIKLKRMSAVLITMIFIMTAILVYPKIFKSDKLENLRSSDGRISIAVMPFQNLTNDTIWNVWQDGIQNELIVSLTNSEELKVRQTESINNLIQSKGLTNYASITPSVARTISQKLDANVFINGSIIKAGTTIRINAQLLDSKKEEAFKSFQINGTADKILNMIDSLSALVKNFLIISKLQTEGSRDLQHFASTCSPEAYRYFTYGNNAFMKTDFTTAVKMYSQAISIDSNLNFAKLMLSFSSIYLNQYHEAIKWCLKAYQKRDQMSIQEKIITNWGYAIFFETPYEQIKYLEQLLEIDDQVLILHYHLGFAYSMLDQYDKAIPQFEKALMMYNERGIKPMWVLNYTNLGIAYHKEREYVKEKNLYRKAELDFPDDPSLIFRQATLSLSEKDSAAANKFIRNYISIRKERSASESNTANNIALMYQEAGIMNKAEEYYRQALSLNPENEIGLNNFAYFLINDTQNINEGMKLIDKALELSPDNYLYLDTKGWGLYRQGRYKEALALIEKSWDNRSMYDHEIFLHLEEVKKAVTCKKRRIMTLIYGNIY